MISETKRRVLAAACGIKDGHIYKLRDNGITVECRQCGDIRDRDLIDEAPPCLYLSFTTAADWELVRVNVVVPYKNVFNQFAINYGYYGDQPAIGGEVPAYKILSWWNNLSPEECNEIAADFVKANISLFPEKAKTITEQEGK